MRSEMLTLPKTLQGTDGIRGRVDDNSAFGQSGALGYFFETGFLTPSFFKRYTYAFGKLLIQSELAIEGDRIVVGWDPRDQKGTFNQAAVDGILKAGLDVLEIGTLPTPAIPIYMIQTMSAGGVVLTASHNPSDQNGIKLFIGHTALKFLPTDDELLTQIIGEQQAIDINVLPIKGKLLDHSDQARRLFVSYHRDAENSWIDGDSFSDTILILDASKGATAKVLEEIFAPLKFKEIIFTNMSGAINENCGVADIEGNEKIAKKDVQNKGARFYRYQTLQEIYSKSMKIPDIRSGRLKLTALVFDGDGDRCFRLDYNPADDDIIVSSGDLLGIHQARYIMDHSAEASNENGFVNTVESDLKTAISAENLGYRSTITGVGDKWILLKAVLDKMRAESESDPDGGQVVLEYLENTRDRSDLSALSISKVWKNYRPQKTKIPTTLDYRFRIGIEESGHAITPGFLTVGSNKIRCFAGNGIKSGLNSLKAVSKNSQYQTDTGWFKTLEQPFAPGVKETFYIYYVDKSRMMPDAEFRESLQTFLKKEVDATLPSGFSSEQVIFPEEKSMLYCRITEKKRVVGAVFVRNSGTEDKSALYLRGEQDLAVYLSQLGETIHLKLLKGLKDRGSDLVDFEMTLLKACAKKKPISEVLTNYSNLPVDRMIREIELKEGLISSQKGSVQLTEKGKLFIEQW